MQARSNFPRAEDHLRIERAGSSLTAVETPVPVVDLDIVERNIRALQTRCDRAGIANRPHVKTHKSAGLARLQVASGAVGVTVQKLGEAEAMVAGGVTDLLLTFNLLGEAKARRLAGVMGRAAIAVTADNPPVVGTLVAAAAAAKTRAPLRVLVECDSGAGRAGVQSPEAAAELARLISQQPGLTFGGLMTYPKPGGRAGMGRFLAEAVRLCRSGGLPCETVTVGGSPDLHSDEGLAEVTEYRVGTSIYCDRSLVARGKATGADCALAVHVTVVSRPTATRAIFDAGTKSLTSDTLGLEGFGTVIGHPEAVIYKLDEEHGYLALPETSAIGPGDRLAVVPNHVCPVSNLFDHVFVHRSGRLLGRIRVDARGAQA